MDDIYVIIPPRDSKAEANEALQVLLAAQLKKKVLLVKFFTGKAAAMLQKYQSASSRLAAKKMWKSLHECAPELDDFRVNFLIFDAEWAKVLNRTRDNISVVYCPRGEAAPKEADAYARKYSSAVLAPFRTGAGPDGHEAERLFSTLDAARTQRDTCPAAIQLKLPVSVLIPTMNRPETLKATLESYLAGSCIPSQIVIVDQSRADLREAVRQIAQACKQTEITCIYQETPSSTMARNNALKYAKYETIVFSDDDIRVYSETLENLYRMMKKKSMALVAGIDDNTHPGGGWIGYLLGARSFAGRKCGHVTKSMLGRYPNRVIGQTDTQWAMGYFFAVKKSLLKRWDIRWDEKLRSYAYAEDLDFTCRYCQRAAAERLHCVLDERVRVKHMFSQECRVPSQTSTTMYVQHRYYLAKKNHVKGATAAMLWCDLWVLVERLIKRQKPADLARAMLQTVRKKRSVLRGEFDY